MSFSLRFEGEQFLFKLSSDESGRLNLDRRGHRHTGITMCFICVFLVEIGAEEGVILWGG